MVSYQIKSCSQQLAHSRFCSNHAIIPTQYFTIIYCHSYKLPNAGEFPFIKKQSILLQLVTMLFNPLIFVLYFSIFHCITRLNNHCHRGTIHLRRRQIFTIFDPYPPTIGIPAKCLWRGFFILMYCDLLTIGTWGHPSPP